MSQQISSVDAQLVTFECPLRASEVLSRLQNELNRPKDGKIFSLDGANNREEIETKINSVAGDNDFMYQHLSPAFSKISHFSPTDSSPCCRMIAG
jgi:hypothetical protein